MTKSIIAGACAAISLSLGADAGFTGFTVEKIVTASGNSQYSVFANFDSAGLPSGKSWVFLQVYNYQGVSGSMNAIHQDAAEDADGNPTSSWSASANTLGARARDNDSWVTASGSGTSAGNGTSLDPSFNNTIFDRIVGSGGGAGWFDATPGTQNLVAVGGTSGFRIKLIQFVRSGNDNSTGDGFYTASMFFVYKVQDTTAPLTGSGNFSIGDPLCAGGPDCNNNGCNDARDIATGSSSDINANGVPDECDPDCNNNDIPDRYELAQGLVPDCNADSTPDDCQGGVRFALVSPNLGAPSGAQAAQYTFTGLRPAESGVTITVRASGDLSGQTEYIDPFLNGVPGARLFGPTGSDCPATPDVATLTLTREQFNTVLGSGTTLNLVLQSSAAVDPGECKGSGSLVAELKYFGIQPSGDCNGNQRLDVCEVYQGVSPDCNGNKKPDSCDIASGFSADCNTNGIPDSCDLASGLDCNTNGIPDSCDVAAGTSPDIDANNKPDECQTVTVNAGGSIQAAIDAAPANEMRIVNVAPGTYAGPINLLGKPIRLIGTGGAALTTISGTGGQNLSVVRAISGEPSISLVKGFTIQGGTTGGPLPGSPGVLAGGGVLFAFSSTSMADCVLQNNGSAFGAGAYLRTHDGSVTGCTFRNNTSQAYAGGLQLFDCTTTVSGCTFSGNLAVTAGGAMHMVNGQPKLVNCSFGANICNEQGGAMSWDPVSNGSLLSLTGCTISGNTASTIGGGIFIYPTGVASETQLVGTTVCGNAVRNISGPYQADATSTVCDCRADLNGDGFVNGVDLAIVLSNWDAVGSSADLTGDGTVNGADLGIILAAWGTCPST